MHSKETSLTLFRQELLKNNHRQLRLLDKLIILSGGGVASFISIFMLVGIIEVLYVIPRQLVSGDIGVAGFLLIHGGMFAGIPSIFFFIGLKKRRSVIHLLERGRTVRGTVQQGRNTGLSVNGQPEKYYTLQFTLPNGTAVTAEDKTLKHWAVTDDVKELILYNPNFPAEAVMVDGLTTSLKIDERLKEVRFSSWRYLGFIGPAIVIAAILCAPVYWAYLFFV